MKLLYRNRLCPVRPSGPWAVRLATVAVLALLLLVPTGCKNHDQLDDDMDDAGQAARTADDTADTVDRVTGNDDTPVNDDSEIAGDPDEEADGNGSGTATDNGSDTDSGTDGQATDNGSGTGTSDTDTDTGGTDMVIDGTDTPDEECLLPPEPNLTRRIKNLEVGQPIRSVKLVKLTALDETVDIAKLRGRWVVMEFWASWCPTCKKIAKEFMAPLYEEYGQGPDARLQMISIGLTINDSPDNQKAEVATQRHNWLHLYDEGNAAKSAFGIWATPTFIVLDPEGNVATWGRPRGGWDTQLREFLVQECLAKE